MLAGTHEPELLGDFATFAGHRSRCWLVVPAL
jgi:hypothetical protein